MHKSARWQTSKPRRVDKGAAIIRDALEKTG
ncbi:Uncharacterised protein [Acinetobacter baumannii]|nr:Uncharacterised protein [Acinetobacter baumannii]SUC46870.1 Uncharacterised protein [Providencia stuartii]